MAKFGLGLLVGMVALLGGCAVDAADGEDGVIRPDDTTIGSLEPTARTTGSTKDTVGGVTYAVGQGIQSPTRGAASPSAVFLYQMDRDGSARLERAFAPYGLEFKGGVSVALGDLNGDGTPDVITGAATGAAHVKVFDGATGATNASFLAFGAAFAGGVRVAVGDVNGDGTADIVVGAGAGGGPHVKVFDGKTLQLVRSFYAFDPSVKAGLRIAVGDFDGDGRADIAAATGAGAGPHVKVFSGKDNSLLASFFAYDGGLTSGIELGTGDFDGDGRADLAAIPSYADGQTAVPLHVKTFSGKSWATISSYLAAPSASGATIAGMPDLDGDGREEVIVATSAFRRVFPSATPGQSKELPAPAAGTSAFVSAVRAK